MVGNWEVFSYHSVVCRANIEFEASERKRLARNKKAREKRKEKSNYKRDKNGI